MIDEVIFMLRLLFIMILGTGLSISYLIYKLTMVGLL